MNALGRIRWDALRVGDVIECPSDRATERVTEVGRRFRFGGFYRLVVRTTRHDHTKVASELVQIREHHKVDRPGSAWGVH